MKHRVVSRDHERSNSRSSILWRFLESLFVGFEILLVFQKRDASLTSKLSERNFKKHFSHWRTVHRFDVTFFLPEQHFYLFHNKKVKYAENTPFDLAYLSSPAKNTQSNEFFLQMNREMPKYIMAALFRMKLAG